MKVRVFEPAKARSLASPALLATCTSPPLALLTVTVTAAVGLLVSFTVKVCSAPPSVTVSVLSETVSPATSTSVVTTVCGRTLAPPMT